MCHCSKTPASRYRESDTIHSQIVDELVADRARTLPTVTHVPVRRRINDADTAAALTEWPVTMGVN